MNENRLAAYRHQLISANLAEFGDTADLLNWISPAGARAAQTERGERLQAIGQRMHLTFKGTKPLPKSPASPVDVHQWYPADGGSREKTARCRLE